MRKIERIAFTAIYAGGTAAVAVLVTAIGAGHILFPEAMLPMELREMASAWLAIVFLPMLFACIQFYKVVRRRVVFLPAGVCLLALLSWVGVWTAGMALA